MNDALEKFLGPIEARDQDTNIGVGDYWKAVADRKLLLSLVRAQARVIEAQRAYCGGWPHPAYPLVSEVKEAEEALAQLLAGAKG